MLYRIFYKIIERNRVLNRVKLLQEMHILSDKLFIDHAQERDFLWSKWQEACKDVHLLQKIQEVQLPWPVAQWSGQLDATYAVQDNISVYQVVAVDGSQIYPDKHQGIGCFLINIGSIILRYIPEKSFVSYASEPFLFVEHESEGQAQTIDIVNGKREEFEFKRGLDEMLVCSQQYPDVMPLFLFDGSLIFWHLEGKDPVVKQYFLNCYRLLLEKYYQHQFLMAGYISLPKSKELVSIVRAYLILQGEHYDTIMQKTRFCTDVHIMEMLLKEGMRSNVFANKTPLSLEYSDTIRPYFFYMRTAYELVRVEIPGYIAHSREKVDSVSALIMNQIKKGYGYPVALAEAHEQAVVKGIDRDFFYHMLDKVGLTKNRRIISSQKSSKKKRINV